MTTYKRTPHLKQEAKKSLKSLMADVSNVLDAIPDNVVRMPSNLAEAFLLVDGVLSILNRQLLDARANYNKISALLGPNDPMMDALNMQIAALEQAYAARMAALIRRREEGQRSHAAKDNDIQKLEVTNLSEVRQQVERRGHKNDILWSWMLFLLLVNQTSMTVKSGPRLEAAWKNADSLN